jgi:hypothetical protein
VNDDPFLLLGLDARAGVSDHEVRAAWRRIAAATHPDRDDGGDPARFGAAAAAYALLRTADGRGEALADLVAAPVPAGRLAFAGRARNARRARPGAARRVAAQRYGWWYRRLLWRAVASGALAGTALLVAGWTPGTVGVLAGLASWLIAGVWRPSLTSDGARSGN